MIVPSIRFEQQDLSNVSTYIETNVADGVLTEDPLQAQSSNDIWNLTENIDIRYTGIRDWSLYATGEWLQEDGTLDETQIALETGEIDLTRQTDSTVFTQKYKIGAIWYVQPRLNIASQYYYKERNYDYDHPIDSTQQRAAKRRSLSGAPAQPGFSDE